MKRALKIKTQRKRHTVKTQPARNRVPATSNTSDTAVSTDRLHELEAAFTAKMATANEKATEAIEVILQIRDERQYVADGFESFDAYMHDRWNHTRQWVEQMDKHLRMIRLMQDKLGIKPDEAKRRLTVYDASILRPLQDEPDVLVTAITEAEEQYKATGKKSPKTLKEAVQKWEGFKKLKDKLQPDGENAVVDIPEPLTVAEFALLDQLRRDKYDSGRLPSSAGKTLIDIAKASADAKGIPLPLALDQVCEKDKSIPPDEQLIREARGEALKELIAPLILRVKLWKAEDALNNSKAHKEAKTAGVEIAKLTKKLAQSPDEKDKQRQIHEKEQKLKAMAEKEVDDARAKDREIWDWEEDDLSLSCDSDPRKWTEQEHNDGEGYHADLLVQIAADCMADAAKRLPLMDRSAKKTTVKAVQKAIKWANVLRRRLRKRTAGRPKTVAAHPRT